MRLLLLFVTAVNALPLAQDAPAAAVAPVADPAAAVAPGPAAAATDASCVSIAPGGNDYWCQIQCAIPTNCPATMCACGEDAAKASPAPAVTAAAPTGAVAQDYAT